MMRWAWIGIVAAVAYSDSMASENWVEEANGCNVVASESQGLRRRVPTMNALPGTVVWHGDCSNGYAQGDGKLEWRASMGFQAMEYYKGSMRKGKRSGQGTLYAHEFGTFAGEWVEDELVSGRYASNSGNASYSGGFRNGQYHGKGVLAASGSITTGVWDNGELVEVISKAEDPPYRRWGNKIQGNTVIKPKPKPLPAVETDVAQ